MGPTAHLLSNGTRLHLQHGPIDLVISAEGDRETAFQAATSRFSTILEELVGELPALRCPMLPETPAPHGAAAGRMHRAVLPHADRFVTRMASVAGAVADEVLAAMLVQADLSRAYVNNGGDIALHLGPDTRFDLAMKDHVGRDLGRIRVLAEDNIGGIATSGRHGRSLSLGIADSVTVLARSAAGADVAATLIANAVDLASHPAIARRPARDVVDESDLGTQSVVTGCDALSDTECATALASGQSHATALQARQLITGAALFLQGQSATTNPRHFDPLMQEALHA